MYKQNVHLYLSKAKMTSSNVWPTDQIQYIKFSYDKGDKKAQNIPI